MTELSFIHRFEPATEPGRPPLLLLHGTGGDENDLLALGRMISPGSALLSPARQGAGERHAALLPPARRGRVRRGGCELPRQRARGFRRRGARGLRARAPVAVGFSNGANIAAAMLLLRPEALAGAALLRAMVPLSQAAAGGPCGQAGADALGRHGPDHAGGECGAAWPHRCAHRAPRFGTRSCRRAMACRRRICSCC